MGIPIKAGSIGCYVGYDALQHYYRQSKEKIGKAGRMDDLHEKDFVTLREASGSLQLFIIQRFENFISFGIKSTKNQACEAGATCGTFAGRTG